MQPFPRDVDAIITNAAGCGSGMHAYGLLFKGEREADKAIEFVKRVKDVSAFLAESGLLAPPPLSQSLKLAYHAACHRAQTQSIAAAPRQLLHNVPNVTLFEIPNSEICCGSAGTYNLGQPEVAEQLGRRRAENILTTGCEAIVAALARMRLWSSARLQPDSRRSDPPPISSCNWRPR